MDLQFIDFDLDGKTDVTRQFIFVMRDHERK